MGDIEAEVPSRDSKIYDVADVAKPYMEVPLKTLRAVTKSNLDLENIF
jgi:hypothetical protein